MEDFYFIIAFCISLLGTFCFISLTKICLYASVCVAAVYALRWLVERVAGMEETRGKAVLITGCDTGFGHDLAVRLDQLKCTVFAGCLHADGAGAKTLRRTCSKRVHVIPLDVGDDDSVARAVKYVKSHVIGIGLWAIVNNAGFNIWGDVEFLNVGLYNKCMNVNFYGAVRVTRAFLFLVRQQKGRVINMSSGRGKFPGPRRSVYHVSKHCLETFSDSLRLEMKKFSVKVSVILPGNYGSTTACQNHVTVARYQQEVDEMWGEATDEMRQTYGDYYLQSLLVGVASNSAPDNVPVTEAMVHSLFNRRPRPRYIVPGDSRWFDRSCNLVKFYPFLPTWLSDLIITAMTECDRFPQKD